MSENHNLLNENPISGKDINEDLFNFKHYADRVRKIIQLNANNNSSLSIGIYGKWGEGKTSFLNILKSKLEHFEKKEGDKEYLIYEFIPWRYSCEEEILFNFFDALAKKFYTGESTTKDKIGKQILRYGKYLKAVKISSTIGLPKVLNTKIEFNPDKVFEALGEDLKGENITLDVLKDKVNEEINKVGFKVIVIIDDIDRLDSAEIYTILKLIKLNANFDNFIFITTLDSEHVAKAIMNRYGESIEDGKLFLEKIINIPIHLPKIENEDLQLFFETKFNQIIKYLEFKDTLKKINELEEIRQRFSVSYFNNPREIIRVLNSFFIGAFGFEEEINLKDLFWIEWIKIKEEKLYDEIKKYNSFGLLSLFNGQDRIIDFNDDQNLNENKFGVRLEPMLNGTREKFIKEFPQCKDVLNFIFPVKTNFGNNLPEGNININSIHHFDKYFSFHTERKISNTLITEILAAIEVKNVMSLKSLIIDLFSDTSKSKKAYFELQNLIKSYDNSDQNNDKNRDFFYLFIVKNLSLIPMFDNEGFEIDSRNRIIEIIATLLNDDGADKNEKLISDIFKSLNIYEVCYFVRKLEDNSNIKNNLEHKIVIKATNLFDNDNPIYLIDNKNPISMIMFYWNKYQQESFAKHIENTLIDKERIKLLIRCFTPFWNNTFYGPIEENTYDYIKKTINVDMIFNKLKLFDPDRIDKVEFNYFKFNTRVENSDEENLDQFIYWYKKDHNQ